MGRVVAGPWLGTVEPQPSQEREHTSPEAIRLWESIRTVASHQEAWAMLDRALLAARFADYGTGSPCGVCGARHQANSTSCY